jgi:predicted dehydrogenase
MTQDVAPIKLAIVGTGFWTKFAHIPALRALSSRFEVVAVCSRTEAGAAAVAEHLTPRPRVTDKLEELLADPTIEAYDLLLPIDLMPAAIERVLLAKKHLISEKPMAPDVASGRRLLARHDKSDRVWMVAENWRYKSSTQQMAEVMQSGEIGKPLLCHLVQHRPPGPTGAPLAEWRKVPRFQGGQLLDAGVHHISALRAVFGEIVELSAVTAQSQAGAPTPDLVTAALRFSSGAVGSYVANYGQSAPCSLFQVVGDLGSAVMWPDRIELTIRDETRKIAVPYKNAVEAELTAFADAIRFGTPHLNSPEEGLRDVAVIEAMLRSAEEKRPVMPDTVASER